MILNQKIFYARYRKEYILLFSFLLCASFCLHPFVCILFLIDRFFCFFLFFFVFFCFLFSTLKDGFQNVKVADFGLGKLVRPNTVLEKKCGTASYVAPEVLTGGGYSKPADMWSVGVIMHLVLRGKLPFQVLFYFFFF